MNSAFHHFMKGLVDYAGLFPPASLDMAPAVVDYARYRDVAESWMLGRFICPAARLGEMAGELNGRLSEGSTWELSVLIGNGQDPAAALAALPGQVEAMNRIQDQFPGQVRVAAMETPIPLQPIAGLDCWLADFFTVLAESGFGDRELFLEVPPVGESAHDALILQGVDRLRETAASESGLVGAKFRCGGVTPEAFPSVGRLAGIIDQGRRLDLALKFTAGLHHPVRHRALEPDVIMHGFLNVFGAGLLAFALDAGLDLLTGCLAETDPAAFSFNDDGFRWRDQVVAPADIERIRDGYLGGFGSCSFAEPCHDLQDLGLLPSTDDLKG